MKDFVFGLADLEAYFVRIALSCRLILLLTINGKMGSYKQLLVLLLGIVLIDQSDTSTKKKRKTNIKFMSIFHIKKNLQSGTGAEGVTL